MHSIRLIFRGIFKLSHVRPAQSCFCSKAENSSPPTPADFQLRRALVVSKLSRYEYECQVHKDLSEEQLEQQLRKRGSNFDLLLHHHRLHKAFEETVTQTLVERGIETQVVNRFSYNEKLVQWADIVFAAGGDGTFLLAASRIRDNQTPLVGLNSDPTRSEGKLCLPKRYTSDIGATIDKLKRGQFQWRRRTRIRITLCGEHISDPPTELHEQDLLDTCQLYFANVHEQSELETVTLTDMPLRCLPILALNEVFVSENFSARVSYFELGLDGGAFTAVKCSGVCVTTGTGSTSWHMSMNRLTQQNLAVILRLLQEEGVAINQDIAGSVLNKFNAEIVFPADDERLSYTVRDLIEADIWPSPKGIVPRGFVRRIEVKSRCFDGGLVVDGTVSFGFNDGTCAVLETHPEDSLLTVFMV